MVNGPVTSALTTMAAVTERDADPAAMTRPAGLIVATISGAKVAGRTPVAVTATVAVVVRSAAPLRIGLAVAVMLAVAVSVDCARIGAAPTVAVAEIAAVTA